MLKIDLFTTLPHLPDS